MDTELEAAFALPKWLKVSLLLAAGLGLLFLRARLGLGDQLPFGHTKRALRAAADPRPPAACRRTKQA